MVALLSLSSCSDNGQYDPANDEPNSGNGGTVSTGPYALIVSAGDDVSYDSRASFDPTITPYTYYWDAAESIKLTIASEGATAPISAISAELDKVVLTSTNTTKQTHVNFVKDNTDDATIYATLQSAPTFDYYAYFANGKTVTDTDFPNTISFTLPTSYSGLTANSFTAAQTPMVGVVKDHAPNILYTVSELNGTLAESVKNGIHFDFDHTTAYASIEFDVRLFANVTVSSLTMTVTGGGTPAQDMINGTYIYDIAAETGSFVSGSGSNSISLSGLNLNIGNGDKLYIPMPAKTFTGQTFTFTCTFNNLATGNSYSTSVTGTPASWEFERGEINPIRIAPAKAIYTANETFTVSHTGYYYIEVWGGNGGNGGDTNNSGLFVYNGSGADGGESLPIRGVYKLNANTPLFVQVGTAGANGENGRGDTDDTGNAAGGTNGISLGYGASGGAGGGARYNNYNWGSISGAGGGGGGAASMVFITNNSAVSNIIIASGGGGGGGGAGGSHDAGAGGDSDHTGVTVGGDSPHGDGGNGWSGSYTYGVSGNGSINGTKSNSATRMRGGGGGGGGGGGWNISNNGGGGQSGTGGDTQLNVSIQEGAGGGGAGGASAKRTEDSYSGYVAPTASTRPADRADGYVVITFLKRAD
jgi:hypothetical protein